MSLTKEEVAGLSIDDILDLSVDQLALVTDFAPRPTGSYGFSVKSCALEEVGEGHGIVVVYTITELKELAEPTDANLEAVGELPAEYKETYFIGGDSDFGLRTFRTIFADLVPEGDEATTRELMERCVGVQGEGLLKHRKWKDKATKEVREGNQWQATAMFIS